MSESNNSLALKGVAAAAGLGILLSACSEGSASSPSGRDVRPADGSVLYVDQTGSPTDLLANQIAQLQALRDEAVRGEGNLAGLETKAKTLAVGGAALTSTIQFKQAQKIQPFPDQALDAKTVVNPQLLKEAANQISDPKIRKQYEAIFKKSIVTKVLDGVRFDNMEQDEARTLLDNVQPGLSQEYTDTLDRLDISEAVISRYYDPSAILPDLNDVRNPGLKAKATRYANTPNTSRANWKLYDDLVKQGDEARNIADAVRNDYYTDASQQQKMIESGVLVDAAAREVIIQRNAVAVAPETVTLPPLADPSKRIDLRQVKGPKRYFSALGPKDPPLHQFAEVYVQDGKVAFRLEDGSNVNPEASAQLQRLVGDVTPLLAHAFKAGDLVSVRFIIGDDYNPYFTSRAKEVHMLLSSTDPLSEEQLRQGLVHEVTHAMVDAAFSETKLSKEEAGLVKNACRMLSNEAYSQYNQALKLNSAALQRLIDQSDGDEKALLLKLKELVDGGKLAETVESDMASSIVTEGDINWTDCEDANFADLMVQVGYAARVSDPSNTYQNILKEFSPAIAASTHSSGAAGTSTSSTKANEHPDFTILFEGWNDAVRKYSLFTRLNEASFVRTASRTKEYLGHSRDNAHELMATIFDITLNNPTELKQLITSLGPDQRAAVNAAIDATYALVTKEHPGLAAGLRSWQKQFTVLK